MSFSIHLAREQDLPFITAIYNEAILTTTATFDTEEKSVENRKEWLLQHNSQYPVIVGEEDGIVKGWASLSKWSDKCAYDGTAEISVYVKEEHRGNGLGKALMHELINLSKNGSLHTIIARIAEGNDPSIYLHKQFGFFQIGVMKEVGLKFGKRLDVVLLQLML